LHGAFRFTNTSLFGEPTDHTNCFCSDTSDCRPNPSPNGDDDERGASCPSGEVVVATSPNDGGDADGASLSDDDGKSGGARGDRCARDAIYQHCALMSRCSGARFGDQLL
jgi:hypothetical protein